MYGFFGHHKCGKLWINSIVYKVATELGLKHRVFYTSQFFRFDLKKTVKKKRLDFVSCINADIKHISLANNDRGFHVVRDPRDIAVSAYFSHRYSHPLRGWPELSEHRRKLSKLSIDEGLMLDMMFCKTLPNKGYDVKLFDTLLNWDYEQSNIMEIKFEELIKDPLVVFFRIFKFLGIILETDNTETGEGNFMKILFNRMGQKIRSPFLFSKGSLSVQRFMCLFQKQSFSTNTGGRLQGEEDVRSHYRKGVAGDWKNYFKKEHKAYFKENFSDLLIKLKYETSQDW
jgi:hypothetical protein